MKRIEAKTDNFSEAHMEVLKQFRVIFGSLKQHFRDIEQRCGVSASQIWLIREITGNPGIGVSTLAKRLSIRQSTCSILIDKLVARSAIVKTRSSEDQRRVGLKVAPRGRRLAAMAPEPVNGILHHALGRLDKGTIASLHENLAELISSMPGIVEENAERPLADI